VTEQHIHMQGMHIMWTAPGAANFMA